MNLSIHTILNRTSSENSKLMTGKNEQKSFLHISSICLHLQLLTDNHLWTMSLPPANEVAER